MQGVATVACAENTTPGTSYLTFPTVAGTYTVTPSTTTDCASLCTAVANAATYNSFPTCGAATCNFGYNLSGSGANATCAASGGGIPLNILQQTNQTNQQQTIIEAPVSIPITEAPASQTVPKSVQNSVSGATLGQMAADAQTIVSADVNKVIAIMGARRDMEAEANYSQSIVAKVAEGLSATAEMRNAITNFVTYGTPATKILGAGERGGVVGSFKAAFGKLPTSESDWNDVIKIANGRWPTAKSKTTEDRASINFKRVYLRNPDMKNKKDETAITVMAYGLRPTKRNVNSEKTAIQTFKKVYGYAPAKSTAWDVVRAIAYSGAIR